MPAGRQSHRLCGAANALQAKQHPPEDCSSERKPWVRESLACGGRGPGLARLGSGALARLGGGTSPGYPEPNAAGLALTKRQRPADFLYIAATCLVVFVRSAAQQ